MLVLSRKIDESVDGTIDEEGLLELLAQARETKQPVRLFSVKVVKQVGAQVRLGFDAHATVKLLRDEINPQPQEETCQTNHPLRRRK